MHHARMACSVLARVRRSRSAQRFSLGCLPEEIVFAGDDSLGGHRDIIRFKGHEIIEELLPQDMQQDRPTNPYCQVLSLTPVRDTSACAIAINLLDFASRFPPIAIILLVFASRFAPTAICLIQLTRSCLDSSAHGIQRRRSRRPIVPLDESFQRTRCALRSQGSRHLIRSEMQAAERMSMHTARVRQCACHLFEARNVVREFGIA